MRLPYCYQGVKQNCYFVIEYLEFTLARNIRRRDLLLQTGTSDSNSAIPQITSVYGRDNIRIKENNIVVTIPFDRLEDTTYISEIQDDAQVKSENAQVNVKHVQVETQNNDVNLEEKVIHFCSEAKSIIEICDYLGFKDRRTVRKILNPLLELGRLAMTVPDKPNSRNQKYISIK